MALYATTAALSERFSEALLIERTDRAQPYTGAIVSAVLARAQDAADSEIEAALRPLYALPLDPVPAVVTEIACLLAYAALWTDGPPPGVAALAAGARDRLSRIAAGTLVLDAAPATP